MSDLKDVVAFMIEAYPHKKELSKERMTKMMYLVDLIAKKRAGHLITTINWRDNQYGSNVDEISELAQNDADINVVETGNFYGYEKELLGVRDGFISGLGKEEQAVVREVVRKTKDLYRDDFLEYVIRFDPDELEDESSEMEAV